jgi:hypothetical protein
LDERDRRSVCTVGTISQCKDKRAVIKGRFSFSEDHHNPGENLAYHAACPISAISFLALVNRGKCKDFDVWNQPLYTGLENAIRSCLSSPEERTFNFFLLVIRQCCIREEKNPTK